MLFLLVNVPEYGTVGYATDGIVVRGMRFACWILKAIETNTE